MSDVWYSDAFIKDADAILARNSTNDAINRETEERHAREDAAFRALRDKIMGPTKPPGSLTYANTDDSVFRFLSPQYWRQRRRPPDD